MLSKRDLLLVRPWEQLRFKNHRNKVARATPAIDFGPPVPRDHVKLKLKKCQKEAERCEKIAQDNIKLLQRLQSIMKVNKVDNYWTEAPPKYIYKYTL
ncbi:uncharacterized protein CFAP97D1 [Ctenocephalides felis]|uniref:uncharacterized protein CFAP97D1 n=1 Tax=Ctenocephalides felis TaxID=7515 RepID=UPI000E6E1FD4|nr:uncharacterized protein CFAP97D1 [Ctenocephalides felis]